MVVSALHKGRSACQILVCSTAPLSMTAIGLCGGMRAAEKLRQVCLQGLALPCVLRNATMLDLTK